MKWLGKGELPQVISSSPKPSSSCYHLSLHHLSSSFSSLFSSSTFFHLFSLPSSLNLFPLHSPIIFLLLPFAHFQQVKFLCLFQSYFESHEHTFFYRSSRIQTHSTFISAPVAAVFNCLDMFKIFPMIASSLSLSLCSFPYSQNFAASLPSVSLFYFTSLVLSSLITSAILFFLQFLSQ